MPGGRPSGYTPEIAAAICAEIVTGKSMRSICADENMPDARTVFRWLHGNEEFRQQYARAKEEQAQALGEDILDIADGENPEDVQRARLRVDARKWLMSKLAPKKYGDKLTHSGDEETPIEHKMTFEWISRSPSSGS